MFVQDDAVGAGYQSSTALTDRWPQVQHGLFHVGQHRLAYSLPCQFLTHRSPLELELLIGVMSVVGVFKVHRCKRAGRVQQGTKALPLHSSVVPAGSTNKRRQSRGIASVMVFIRAP